jgi:hypothetical protein
MQLTYRGIQYTNAPISLTMVDSHRTGTYRGVTYSILPTHPVALVAANLKYRGIAYAQGCVKTSETVYQPGSRPAAA